MVSLRSLCMRSAACVFSFALLFCTFAAASHGASLTLDRACYRNEMPVSFTASGFAAGASLELRYRLLGDSLVFLGQLDADGAGNASGSFRSPGASSSGESQYEVVASDSKTSESATASLKAVELGVGMDPQQAKFDAQVRFLARGFVETPGGTLYAHYAYSQSDVKKQYLQTVAIGALDQCGSLTTGSVKQLPFSPKQAGSYIVQFDTSPTYVYQPSDRPYIERSVFVDSSALPAKKRCKIVKHGKRKKKVCRSAKK